MLRENYGNDFQRKQKSHLQSIFFRIGSLLTWTYLLMVSESQKTKDIPPLIPPPPQTVRLTEDASIVVVGIRLRNNRRR